MKLSIVVVSYNVKGYLSLCLSSALRAMEKLGAGQSELFVVDNASSDGSVEWVRLSHPSVKVIASSVNAGFSAANNQALRQAQGEWVLLLNPDTIVPEDTFVRILDHVEGEERIGGLGVPMYDGAGQWLPESKRGVPTPWASFSRLSGLWRLAPRSRRWNGYYFGHVGARESADVEVLSGAFMWMRKAALDEVGLLDEAFFMYGEDIDLSVRILNGGWVNRYFSEAPVVHFKGESTKKGSLSYVRVFHDAMRIFSEKHFAGGQARAMRWMIRLGIRLRSVSAFFQGVVERNLFAVLDVGGIGLLAAAVIGLHGLSTGRVHPFGPAGALVVIGMWSAWWTGRWFGTSDRPFHRLRVMTAGFAAAISVVVLYSSLSESLRVSRLSSFIVALLALLLPLVIRGTMAVLTPEKFRWRTARPRVGIAAPASGIQRLVSWLEGAYGSSLDLQVWTIPQGEMAWMNGCDLVLVGAEAGGQACLDAIRLGGEAGVDVRIVPEDQLLALGGLRREGAPAARLSWGADGLGRADRLRAKRRLDVLWSAIVLLIGTGSGRMGVAASRRDAWRVLRGKATWLGFHRGWEGDERLPQLLPGVMFVGTGSRAGTPSEAERLDLRHAADFGWMRDLELLMNLRMD